MHVRFWMLVVLGGLLGLFPLVAHAQLLTQAQCITLSNDAYSVPEFAPILAAGAANQLSEAYNVPASPSFHVWKTAMSPAEYRSAIVWTEVDALAEGKARIFEWITGDLLLPMNVADPNIQQGLRDAWAPGTGTRTNLLAAGQRPALRGERLFATGTGSSGSPGTMTYEGMITTEDAARAIQHPTTEACNELGS